MVGNWFLLVLMASSVVFVQAEDHAEPLEGHMDMRSFDRDYSGEGFRLRQRHRFHYEISKARKALEKANDDAAYRFVTALQDFSDAQLNSTVNVSDATANIIRYIRRNPSQMADVIANLPRLMTLDRHKQLMETLNIVNNHVADLDHVLRISIENVTNALGGVRPGDNNHPGRYRENDGPWGNQNIFGGFSRTFRNLMDSTYAVLRPYDSNYNWRDNYY